MTHPSASGDQRELEPSEIRADELSAQHDDPVELAREYFFNFDEKDSSASMLFSTLVHRSDCTEYGKLMRGAIEAGWSVHGITLAMVRCSRTRVLRNTPQYMAGILEDAGVSLEDALPALLERDKFVLGFFTLLGETMEPDMPPPELTELILSFYKAELIKYVESRTPRD